MSHAATRAASPGISLDVVDGRGKLAVGGVRLLDGLAAADLPFAVGRVTHRGDIAVWGLAADEMLLILAAADAPTDTPALTTLRSAGAAVTDVSAGLVELRLAGPRLRSLLEELSPAEPADAPGSDAIVQGPIANVRVSFAMEGAGSEPACTILVPRDLEWYLRGIILEAIDGLGRADAHGDAARP